MTKVPVTANKANNKARENELVFNSPVAPKDNNKKKIPTKVWTGKVTTVCNQQASMQHEDEIGKRIFTFYLASVGVEEAIGDSISRKAFSKSSLDMRHMNFK